MNNLVTIHDRIKQVVDTLADGKNTLLATRIGVSEANIRGYIKGNMPKADFLEKIVRSYDVSSEWLLTGQGEMLRNRQQNSEIRDDNSVEIVTNPDNLPADGRPTATAAPSVDPSVGIPLIPIDAMAGYLRGEVSVTEAECDRFVIPGVVADYIISVRGDSMVPLYCSGDLVACRRLSLTDIFFQWGKAYIVDTSQGVVIKRLRPGSTPDTITFVSENPAYDPFELRREEIYHVSLVTALVRIL
jgi:phage repressor protein C with HTH and peptisase S24 domain